MRVRRALGGAGARFVSLRTGGKLCGGAALSTGAAVQHWRRWTGGRWAPLAAILIVLKLPPWFAAAYLLDACWRDRPPCRDGYRRAGHRILCRRGRPLLFRRNALRGAALGKAAKHESCSGCAPYPREDSGLRGFRMSWRRPLWSSLRLPDRAFRGRGDRFDKPPNSESSEILRCVAKRWHAPASAYQIRFSQISDQGRRGARLWRLRRVGVLRDNPASTSASCPARRRERQLMAIRPNADRRTASRSAVSPSAVSASRRA